MEQLTYPYGETPEEVIIERWQEMYGARHGDKSLPKPPQLIATTVGMANGVGALDEFLTTLYTLALAWKVRDGGEIGELRHVKADAAATLRIKLLAALNINEEG